MINANNLQQTCGQCHVGASENFTKGKIHFASELVSNVETRDMGARGHADRALDLSSADLSDHRRHGAAQPARLAKEDLWPGDINNARSFRLTANQRVQHWLLLTSFIVLVLSGFALQYPDSCLAGCSARANI